LDEAEKELRKLARTLQEQDNMNLDIDRINNEKQSLQNQLLTISEEKERIEKQFF